VSSSLCDVVVSGFIWQNGINASKRQTSFLSKRDVFFVTLLTDVGEGKEGIPFSIWSQTGLLIVFGPHFFYADEMKV